MLFGDVESSQPPLQSSEERFAEGYQLGQRNAVKRSQQRRQLPAKKRSGKALGTPLFKLSQLLGSNPDIPEEATNEAANQDSKTKAHKVLKSPSSKAAPVVQIYLDREKRSAFR